MNKPYCGVDQPLDSVVFRVHATDFDADENKEVRSGREERDINC